MFKLAELENVIPLVRSWPLLKALTRVEIVVKHDTRPSALSKCGAA
jgi:hypothetical protein